MKDTRAKILEAALGLFNEYGMVNVSLRQIAQALSISQGNLNYHFKLKEEIIETLYFQLVSEMDQQMNELDSAENELSTLYQMSLKTMEKMYKYKFILIDFIHLMRENKSIKSHYTELMQRRSEEFQHMFQSLVKSKLLRPQEFENEYQRLYKRMNILGDSWINFQLTFEPNKGLKHYCNLLFEIIYPYLTKNGKEAFRNISNLKFQ
ncbi:TetR/AcrR family transcriptional regulator [Marivirga harenae]|uniref:TetR/AcrR family transcriptional regulator n=1 Tax=Marivirga harenae TaxID=2010992 RepID=UPI0026DFEFBE|nr:TetR/AcrR family transcriptional regulator [Marivirga harenae]WKV13971.1 TetR/AcrR family transcriptional regulator [Marivirga harenae]